LVTTTDDNAGVEIRAGYRKKPVEMPHSSVENPQKYLRMAGDFY
jgi:hypothetical protein